MEIKNNLKVRPASRGDITHLDELISRGYHVHRHMDWRAPLEWIDKDPFYVLERNGSIASVLACPPDPTTIGWIRVFAVNGSMRVETAWKELWDAIKPLLPGCSISCVALIAMGEWFQNIMEKSEFNYHQDIIMMKWENEDPIDGFSLDAGLQIRPMTPEDLPLIAILDGQAFEPIWENSLDALSIAYKMAAYSTVVTDGDRIIAYQISTQNLLGGHLARLAVHPDSQGRGIGKSLVLDLMSEMDAKGAQRITVNTQSDNPASIALYNSLGFKMTGEKYPVYIFDI